MGWKQTTVVILDNGTTSAAFHKHPGYRKIGAAFPDMIAGAVGLEMTNDGGTTWYPVIDIGDGADLELLASGSDPGYVEFTDHVAAIPVDTDPAADKYLLRFTCASQTSGPLNVYVIEHS